MRTMYRAWWHLGVAVVWTILAVDAIARESVEYVLSHAAIEKVSVEESDDRLRGPTYFRVIVQVSDAEAKRLAVLTRDNVEKELTIVWDGQVLFTPIIREEVRRGRFAIPRRTKEEAEELARRLRGRAE